MSRRVVYTDSLSRIADKIRERSGSDAGMMFPSDFENGVDEVYEAGYKMGMNDFANNKNIGDYYNDQITSLAMYAFAGRSSITSVTLPNLTWASNHVFYYCSGLKRASLPAWSGDVTHNMFNQCSKLEFVDLGGATKLGSAVFQNCKALTTIVLRNETLVELFGVSVFDNTPFAEGGTGGTIYVPSTLIESYKTATNWSALYEYGTVDFVAIEGSEYE